MPSRLENPYLLIILVGSSHRAKRLEPLLDAHCYRCNRDVTWEWRKVTERITLFFIPLLPIGDQHFLVCAGCGDALKLTKSQTDGVRRRRQLPQDESQELHDALVEALEHHQLRDKTETQRDFLKSRRP